MKTFALSNYIKHKIVKASVGLIAINMLSKVFGYGEKLLLAKYFGTGAQVDVYTAVLTLVLSFYYFFREVVEPSVLRVYLEKEKENKGEHWEVFNYGIRIIVSTTFVATLLIYIFPEKIIKLFASGFKGEQFVLATDLLRKMIVSCIFLSLSTLTSIILNARKYFVFPALGDLIFKLVIIVGLISIDPNQGISGIAIAVIIASLLKLVTHLVLLFNKVHFKKLNIIKATKHQILGLSLPLLAGVVFSQLSGILDNNFASNLQEGAIASISYAKKVIELPIVVLPYVLSIVIFPYFSELSLNGEVEKLRAFLGKTLYFLILLFLPLTLYFFCNGFNIIELIFKRGAFDAQSVLLTYKPFLIYTLGLLFFAIETVVVVYYFSLGDTKTPVIVGIVCVCINIVLTWLFIKYIGYLGIPLAYVIQKVIKNLWLLILKRNDFKVLTSYFQNKLFVFLVSITMYLILVLGLKKSVETVMPNIHGTILNLTTLSTSFIIPYFVYIFILWKYKALNQFKI
jgi:murein biosynthesis integral membrane protein MurJ